MNTTLLTLDEAAEQLGLSKITLYRMRRDGEIRSGGKGRRCRIRQVDLDAYVARTYGEEGDDIPDTRAGDQAAITEAVAIEVEEYQRLARISLETQEDAIYDLGLEAFKVGATVLKTMPEGSEQRQRVNTPLVKLRAVLRIVRSNIDARDGCKGVGNDVSQV